MSGVTYLQPGTTGDAGNGLTLSGIAAEGAELGGFEGVGSGASCSPECCSWVSSCPLKGRFGDVAEPGDVDLDGT